MSANTSTHTDQIHNVGLSSPHPAETHQKAGGLFDAVGGESHAAAAHWSVTRDRVQMVTEKLDRGLVSLAQAKRCFQGAGITGRSKEEFTRNLGAALRAAEEAAKPKNATWADVSKASERGELVRSSGNYNLLPVYAKVAIDWMVLGTSERTVAKLDEVLASYAATYGLTVDVQTCADAHAVCAARLGAVEA